MHKISRGKRKAFYLVILYGLLATPFWTPGTPLHSPPLPATEDYFPGDVWESKTPEEVGLNPDLLNAMYTYIANIYLEIHSIIVLRDGYLLIEDFFYQSEVLEEKQYSENYYDWWELWHPSCPCLTQSIHPQFSTTKSVIALLIGIAIEEGYLTGVNQTLYEFFADEWLPAYDDKQIITIEQLLTHNSGLSEDFNVSIDSYLNEALLSNLLFTPGTPGEYMYSNLGVNLLGAILTKVYGENASVFAQEYLFGPMGISADEYMWIGDSNNVVSGAAGLSISPQMQAKIGLVCLNNGTWNDTQLIPADWIRECTSYKIDLPWDNEVDPYGYCFYLDENGAYHTLGYGSQCIYIIPEDNMVIGFTAYFPSKDAHFITYKLLINTFIRQTAVDPHFIPQLWTPAATRRSDTKTIEWLYIAGVDSYNVYINGTLFGSSFSSSLDVKFATTGVYAITVGSVCGGIELALSDPVILPVNIEPSAIPGFSGIWFSSVLALGLVMFLTKRKSRHYI